MQIDIIGVPLDFGWGGGVQSGGSGKRIWSEL